MPAEPTDGMLAARALSLLVRDHRFMIELEAIMRRRYALVRPAKTDMYTPEEVHEWSRIASEINIKLDDYFFERFDAERETET